MQLETFRGPDLGRVLRDVRAARGEDALVLSTRRLRREGRDVFEVVVGDPEAVERFRARLEAEPPRKPRDSTRPYVIALVGPAGAGKTTTAAKIALHPRAFGELKVGLLTLDTFRVAAIEQLQTYADIAGLPFEVVYDAAEVAGALKRLSACDVVIVDTPGRGPKSGVADEWRAPLAAVDADEVHLVLPAGLRSDVALAMADAFAACGTTHLLLTKLDEVPGGDGVAELADRLGMPARWVCDGQDVPADLRPAAARLLESLGVPAPEALRASA